MVIKDIEATLIKYGFEKNKSYAVVGVNKAGCRSVEGLIPDKYKNKVNADNPESVQNGIHGTKEEQKYAKNKLKAHYLTEFNEHAIPKTEDYAKFYKLVKLCIRHSNASTSDTLVLLNFHNERRYRYKI